MQESTVGVGATDRNQDAVSTLVAALLGFFTITLDAVVVNVILPAVCSPTPTLSSAGCT